MRASHDPFKPFEGWQDTDETKADVEKAFAKGARVTVETLRRARARVVADGWHGPISDKEWLNLDGRPMPMHRAMAIIHAAQDADLPRVMLTHPDVGYACAGAEECRHPDHEDLDDAGPLFHEEPVELSREDLMKWYCAPLVEIYGSVWL